MKLPHIIHPDATPAAASNEPERPVPPCGCDKDPIEGLKKLFVDFAQGRTVAAGRDPATRPVFLRLHGVAHGTFKVNPDLNEDLRVGVFAQKAEYPVWVRFSSDVQPGAPDLKGTVGIGIKLFGVEGDKIMAPDKDATTHDFILQNHDVFFVDTAKDMCEFTCQSLNNKSEEYLAAHPVTAAVLKDMEKVVESVLATPYWSVLPSKLGDGMYVKYKIEPEIIPPGGDAPPDLDDPFYLRADLLARLRKGGARLRFFVQRRKGDDTMPLDKATVRWSEEESPPEHVATLILPQQDIEMRGQATYGENLAFNTWHALPEHQPVGSLAEARKVVYRASAEVRRNVNGVPVGEPAAPRPPSWRPGVDYPDGKDATVVRAAIHPSIGIARVGDSESEFFFAPEVTAPLPAAPGHYRDPEGALKRQAVLFRIYGYNAAGEVVQELSADVADIRWTAHVANRKASWYQWQMALDIPEAATLELPLRNAAVKGEGRKELDIDGKAISIQGKGTHGQDYEFRGAFTGEEVYLGELRTDDAGRLIFLGGRGKSASPKKTPIYDEKDENTFINADGWYDDISDGPVTAEINIQGRSIPVEPAWVVTAPPNYAPTVIGVRTLHDLLYDLYIQNGWLQFPEQVSFRRDVYPILHRLSNLQWVNKGFATQFGRGGPNNFEDPAYVAKLASRPASKDDDTYAELRRQVLNSFRPPEPRDGNQLPWPWIYGDGMTSPAGNSPRQNATISATQHRVLTLWAEGEFDADWVDAPEPPHTLAEVPLAEQPAMLDRAALDLCLADAFHPGCEVTWPVRHISMYTAPYRIRHRSSGDPEEDYGPTLTQQEALSWRGPLNAQGPGGLTRWMGLPWQADTAFCRSGYDAAYDPYLPTFWPARVPNQVLTEAGYDAVRNLELPREKRLAAFAERASWTDVLQGSAAEQMKQMVARFGEMGLLEVREGIKDDPDFPPVMLVASFGKDIAPKEAARLAALEKKRAPAEKGVERPQETRRQRALRKAGWRSEEEAQRAPLPVRHPKK